MIRTPILLVALTIAAPAAATPPPVTALAYRPDGQLLAAGTRGVIHLIDPDKGEVVADFPGQTGRVTAAAFSQSGVLAVASGDPGRSGVVRLYDTRDPKALHYIRSRTTIPVASCECLFGRRDYRPYFEQQAVDVAIIDTPWNGVAESVKIASIAEAYEINVAPHNFYGHLATMMNIHFCAVVPNLRIMEIDPDVVPWYDELVTVTPVLEQGFLRLPTGPGWGTEVNEAAVKAHPPRKRA